MDHVLGVFAFVQKSCNFGFGYEIQVFKISFIIYYVDLKNIYYRDFRM